MATAGELIVSIVGDMAGLSNTFKAVQNEIGNLGSSLKKTGENLSSTGASLSKGVTAPIVAIGAGIGVTLAKATDFDTGMRRVATMLPGLTEEGFTKISNQALDLSKQFGTSTTDMTNAMYQALSSGIPQDNIFQFMQDAEKLAIGGATDVVTSTDVLTNAVNSYGAANLSTAQASDILFQGTKFGKSTVEELAASLSDVVPVAASLGVSFADVNASLATMTIQGTSTGQATTQLRAIIDELGNQASVAGQTFQQLSGQTFTDFIKNGGTVGGAIQILNSGVGQLNGATGITATSVRDFFSRIEAGTGALQLATDNGNLYKQSMEGMGQAAGSTQQAYETMSSGLGASWDKIRAALDVFIIELGEKFMPIVQGTLVPLITDTVIPAIESILPIVENLMNRFGALSPQLQLVILGAIGLVAALGPFLVILGPMVSGIGVLIGLFSGAIGTIVLIAGAVVLVYEAFKHWDQIGPIVNKVLDTVKQFISSAIDSIEKFFKQVDWQKLGSDVLNTIRNGLNAAIPAISGVITTVITAIQGYFKNVDWGKLGSDTLNLICKGISSATTAISNAINNVITAIQNYFKNVDWNKTGQDLLNKLRDGINAAIPAVSTVINSVITSITSGFSKSDMGKSGSDLIQKLKDGIIAASQDAAALIGPTVTAIQNYFAGIDWGALAVEMFNKIIDMENTQIPRITAGFSELLTDITNWINGVDWAALGSQVATLVVDGLKIMGALILVMLNETYQVITTTDWSTVLNFIASVLEAIGAFIMGFLLGLVQQITGIDLTTAATTIWNTFSTYTNTALNNIWTDIKNIFSGIYTTIQTELTNAYNSVVSIVTNIYNTINTWFNNALNTARTIFNNIYTAIQTAFTTAYNTVVTIATNIYNSINTHFNNALNTARTIFQNIYTAIQTAFTTAYNTVVSIATNIYNSINTHFTNALNTARTIFQNIYTAIQTAFNNAYNTVVTTATNIYNSINNKFNDALTAAKTIFNNIYTAINEKIGNAKTAVETGVTNMYNAINNKVTDFYNAGKALVQNLIDGINSKISDLETAASKLASKAASYLPMHSPALIGPLSTLPHWEDFFENPINKSINKTTGTIEEGLGKISQIVNNTTTAAPVSNSYADTITIGPNNISSPLDLQDLIDKLVTYQAQQRRARGVFV